MEIISKVSKGSKMDQIYLPKNRSGMEAGSYVVVKVFSGDSQEIHKEKIKPIFYGRDYLEPIKLEIILKIFSLFDKFSPENIIITGSFLKQGFIFNDIDILVISENKLDETIIQKEAKKSLGIKLHILSLTSKELAEGLAIDPIYENMLSRCISSKRLVFNVKRKIRAQILDLHLLKSKNLIDNFDILTGSEKYYLVKNLLAIALFLKGQKINDLNLESEAEHEFRIKISKIKENLLEKQSFLKKFKQIYNNTLKLLEQEAKKNGAESK